MSRNRPRVSGTELAALAQDNSHLAEAFQFSKREARELRSGTRQLKQNATAANKKSKADHEKREARASNNTLQTIAPDAALPANKVKKVKRRAALTKGGQLQRKHRLKALREAKEAEEESAQTPTPTAPSAKDISDAEDVATAPSTTDPAPAATRKAPSDDITPLNVGEGIQRPRATSPLVVISHSERSDPLEASAVDDHLPSSPPNLYVERFPTEDTQQHAESTEGTEAGDTSCATNKDNESLDELSLPSDSLSSSNVQPSQDVTQAPEEPVVMADPEPGASAPEVASIEAEPTSLARAAVSTEEVVAMREVAASDLGEPGNAAAVLKDEIEQEEQSRIVDNSTPSIGLAGEEAQDSNQPSSTPARQKSGDNEASTSPTPTSRPLRIILKVRSPAEEQQSVAPTDSTQACDRTTMTNAITEPRTPREVSTMVVMPQLAILSSILNPMDYNIYKSAWSAWYFGGVNTGRFQHAVAKLLINEEAQDAHEKVLAGVERVKRMLDAEDQKQGQLEEQGCLSYGGMRRGRKARPEGEGQI